MEGKRLQCRCATSFLSGFCALLDTNGTLEALGTSNDPGGRRAEMPVGQVDPAVVAQQAGTSPLYRLIGMQAVFSPTAWR